MSKHLERLASQHQAPPSCSCSCLPTVGPEPLPSPCRSPCWSPRQCSTSAGSAPSGPWRRRTPWGWAARATPTSGPPREPSLALLQALSAQSSPCPRLPYCLAKPLPGSGWHVSEGRRSSCKLDAQPRTPASLPARRPHGCWVSHVTTACLPPPGCAAEDWPLPHASGTFATQPPAHPCRWPSSSIPPPMTVALVSAGRQAWLLAGSHFPGRRPKQSHGESLPCLCSMPTTIALPTLCVLLDCPLPGWQLALARCTDCHSLADGLCLPPCSPVHRNASH